MIYVNLWTRSNKYKIICFKTKVSVKEQNTLSYLTPTVWNNLPTCVKLSNTLSSFKHGVKEHFSKKPKNQEQDIFVY